MDRFQAVADARRRGRRPGAWPASITSSASCPRARLALELVRSGAIGRPRRGEILGRYPIWARPESRGMTWLSDASRGGGILGALGSHHTDCLRTFFGEPRSVLATRARRPAAARPGRARRALRHRDGRRCVHAPVRVRRAARRGLVDLSACAPYRWERFEIHGEEGDAALGRDRLRALAARRRARAGSGRDPGAAAARASARATRRCSRPFGVLVDRLHARHRPRRRRWRPASPPTPCRCRRAGRGAGLERERDARSRSRFPDRIAATLQAGDVPADARGRISMQAAVDPRGGAGYTGPRCAGAAPSRRRATRAPDGGASWRIGTSSPSSD